MGATEAQEQQCKLLISVPMICVIWFRQAFLMTQNSVTAR